MPTKGKVSSFGFQSQLRKSHLSISPDGDFHPDIKGATYQKESATEEIFLSIF
jgi:hypothetical protein